MKSHLIFVVAAIPLRRLMGIQIESVEVCSINPGKAGELYHPSCSGHTVFRYSTHLSLANQACHFDSFELLPYRQKVAITVGPSHTFSTAW